MLCYCLQKSFYVSIEMFFIWNNLEIEILPSDYVFIKHELETLDKQYKMCKKIFSQSETEYGNPEGRYLVSWTFW